MRREKKIFLFDFMYYESRLPLITEESFYYLVIDQTNISYNSVCINSV